MLHNYKYFMIFHLKCNRITAKYWINLYVNSIWSYSILHMISKTSQPDLRQKIFTKVILKFQPNIADKFDIQALEDFHYVGFQVLLSWYRMKVNICLTFFNPYWYSYHAHHNAFPGNLPSSSLNKINIEVQFY